MTHNKEVVKITKKITIKTPLVPNFVRTMSGEAISIADLTDAELRCLGQAWTRSLLDKAFKQRKSAEVK